MSKDDVKKEVEKRLKFPGEETPENTALTSITPPYQKMTNTELGQNKIHQESAGLIGATSDQVITDSPGAEYGAQGRFALDGVIAASERIAREKYRATHPKEEK